jgi:hypothetical protein
VKREACFCESIYLYSQLQRERERKHIESPCLCTMDLHDLFVFVVMCRLSSFVFPNGASKRCSTTRAWFSFGWIFNVCSLALSTKSEIGNLQFHFCLNSKLVSAPPRRHNFKLPTRKMQKKVQRMLSHISQHKHRCTTTLQLQLVVISFLLSSSNMCLCLFLKAHLQRAKSHNK